MTYMEKELKKGHMEALIHFAVRQKLKCKLTESNIKLKNKTQKLEPPTLHAMQVRVLLATA